MPRKFWRIALLLAAVVLGIGASAALHQAFAAEGTATIPPCSGDHVAGTVVAVDTATNMVTVNTGSGLCSVTFNGTYNQPIVSLLGRFFGDISAGKFTNSLDATKGCAVLTGTTWTWAACTDPGAKPIQVTTINPDGTFSATVQGMTTTVKLSVPNPTISATLSSALKSLSVYFQLDGTGDLVQVSDQIAKYHADGMGFGVLVKLYAISQNTQSACTQNLPTAGQACGVTVDQLVTQFKSGMGMGQLYKQYGKPGLLGVGHVRKQFKNGNTAAGTTGTGTSGTGSPGTNITQPPQPTPAPPGNGNGNGKGHTKPPKVRH